MQKHEYRPAPRGLALAAPQNLRSGLSLPVLALALLLSACMSTTQAPVREPTPPTPSASAQSAPGVSPEGGPAICPPPTVITTCPAPEQPKPPTPPWRSADWSALVGWQQDKLVQAWPTLLASCKAMRADMQKTWSATCDAARELGPQASEAMIREFLQARLAPWQLINADGSEQGLITGYYEPLIHASRTPTARYTTPVLGVPDDLVIVDLGDLYPELKSMRLRGRVEGRKLVPYWSNGQLTSMAADAQLPAKTLMWVDDAVEYLFLQIQGSGQAQFADGSRVRIAYADQNGHPFKSIGRWLIDKGELTLDKASMQGIQTWARANPQRLPELIAANPSYVFFREEAAALEGPRGALGLPLTAGRSIAVDARNIPLGAPVFLAFNMPDGKPMQRLMLAQDTGGAIRGRVRADFYWGFGAEAGAMAGRMRQQGRMWILWPQGSAPGATAP